MKIPLVLLPLLIALASAAAADPAAPCYNSLGMTLAPVAGTSVRFAIWPTRVKDFAAFVEATGYAAEAGMLSLKDGKFVQEGATWRNPGFSQTPDHPVCGVSWIDAHAFCDWLTKKERAAGLITPRQHYRLPTDEEWSLAAGLPPEGEGSPAEKSKRIPGIYHWGKTWPPEPGCGNYDPKSGVDDFEYTSPVGTFRPNAFGLYDMGGNVWQMCEDRMDPAKTRIVRRGGSFRNAARTLASARDSNEPDYRRSNIGFRCVLAGDGVLPGAGTEENVPPTMMTRPGRLLLHEEFDRAPPAATGDVTRFASGFRGWRYNRSPRAGHWEASHGVFRGRESIGARHPATASFGLGFKDLIIACELRLDDVPLDGRAKHSISLRFTDAEDYVSGVYLDEDGIKLRKEDHDHGGPDKLAIISELKRPMALGQWQPVVVEIMGEEMMVTVNGSSITGRHPAFGAGKHSFMLLVGGDGSVRRLKVWEALPVTGSKSAMNAAGTSQP